MQAKLVTGIVATGILAVLAVPVFAQESPYRSQKQPTKPPPQTTVNIERLNQQKGTLRTPSGPSFFIGPVDGNPAMFSVLLADGVGNTVAGTFTLGQVDVFEAVLEEARAFALSDEKVGSGNPITTRLMEQREWSLFVDVSKVGDKSRFFISLITPQGKLTAPAGEITRGSKKEQSAMLLNVITQVRDAKMGIKSAQ